MATIIALDNSLSMQRCIPGRNDDNQLTCHQLALKGISQLLEHLGTLQLEYVSLLTYSSKCEVRIDFTRDYDIIRQVVKKTEYLDKTDLISLLKAVSSIMLTSWGTQNPRQVCIFTDCGIGAGPTRLTTFLQKYLGKEQDLNYISKDVDADYSWIEPLKQVKLNFICMGVHSDNYFMRAVSLYQEVLDFLALKGQFFLPKALKDPNENDCAADVVKNTTSSHKCELGRTAMFELVERVCENNYKPFETILKCGGYFRLESSVIIWPAPVPHTDENGIKTNQIIRQKIELCGYIPLADMGSPPAISRHFILPKIDRDKPTRRGSDKSNSLLKSQASIVNKTAADGNQQNAEFEKLEQEIRDFFTKDVKDTDESGDDGEANTTKLSASSVAATEMQKESACVLLHGAIKAENLAALVLLRENWYGLIYSHTDHKKKSNLMLMILPPGNNVIPWLGDFRMLGLAEDVTLGESCSFPVKSDKRSYSQSCVSWIRTPSLQSDIQKVIRHAKKMPEKTQHFYKELNRIRRAALSIGFIELLEMLAMIFEREITHLSLSANPECALQLKHASIELRKPSNRDLKISIVPMVVPKITGGSSAEAYAAY